MNTKTSKVTTYDNAGEKLYEQEFVKADELFEYIEKIGHDIKVTYDFNEVEDATEAAVMAVKFLDSSVRRMLDDGAVEDLEFVKE